ncbi:metallophosphoesterase [Microbacterium esteraromaticum]|uniref:metallophosphoesterase n=1 Tax=Microbacterium esteraromaticum TaxID=57043 RepID=UPI002368AC27|nr:metallophosphoesterase [Microbacterium esteraromaticum]WDH78201.1 metallophosphoesterase [Microbacterium esteraromaticum]
MPTFAISDIHGHALQLRRALATIPLQDPRTQLVLLGDYIDRGPDSFGVLELVRQVQHDYPDQVTALAGNHDRWFLDWLDGDDDELNWLMNDIDLGTVKSLLDPMALARALGHEEPTSDASSLDGPTMNHNIKTAVRARHGELIVWIRALPLVHETGSHVFVHAGVDEEAGDLWRHGTSEHVFTEKFPATTGPMLIGKRIVAGHVGTALLHGRGLRGDSQTHGVFADEGHLYIDGSVETTGLLNVLRIDDDGEWSETAVGLG